MEHEVKMDFAKKLGYGKYAHDLPEHVVAMYDRYAKMAKAIHSARQPEPIRDHVAIAILADIYKEVDDRLKAMEDAAKPIPYEIGIHDPEMIGKKVVDGRTKEGRAARQTATVGA